MVLEKKQKNPHNDVMPNKTYINTKNWPLKPFSKIIIISKNKITIENKHNPNSSLLIGELKNDDIIKIRSDNNARLK